MNKMAKGAVATAAGVVLLIGGGGTLALWEQSDDTKAGVIAAGDLNLVAHQGQWASKDASGTLTPIAAIADFKVVPGDVLVYTQEVDITLVGDNMKAKLTVEDSGVTDFEGTSYSTAVTLLNGTTPMTLPNDTLTTSIADASAQVEFKFLDVGGRVDVGAEYDFEKVGFKLEQIVP